MKVRVAALFGAFSLLSCGSRTALELPRALRSVVPDGGSMDAGRDAGHADAGDHDGPCQWTYAPPVKYDISGYPGGVAIGDFDGDGLNDVLTVNGSAAQIALLKNLGGGELALQNGGPVGTSVVGFASADLSGDGSLDLAVLYLGAPGSTTSIGIYLNRGDGTFSSTASYLNKGGSSGIVSGDFNGDGRVDLLAWDGGMSVNLLINMGNGTFQFLQEEPTGAYASYVTTGDFNRDGALDLAVAGAFSIALLFNQGNAHFGAPTVYTNSTACDDVGPLVAGDLNGDGYPDLVRSCYQAGDNVAVRKNNRDGTLSDELTYEVGQWPLGMVLGDFTGHGQNDLATANSWAYANSVSVLPSLGDGTFAPERSFDATSSSFIAAGDLNGDGHADLAAAGSTDYTGTSGVVSVLLSTCE